MTKDEKEKLMSHVADLIAGLAIEKMGTHHTQLEVRVLRIDKEIDMLRGILNMIDNHEQN